VAVLDFLVLTSRVCSPFDFYFYFYFFLSFFLFFVFVFGIVYFSPFFLFLSTLNISSRHSLHRTPSLDSSSLK
jgi:hypothetical protein